MFRSPRIFQAIAGSMFALAIAAPASAAKFTITIDDADACTGTWQTTGNAASPTVTCVTDGSTPPPAGAPTCNATSSQTISSGTEVTLTLANCTQPGGGPLSYEWRQGSTAATPFATAASAPVTPALTTSYYGKVTDAGSGLSTTYTTTITVTTSAPPPSASCTGYTTKNLGDLKFDGSQVESNGMRSGYVAYGRVVIPDPLPANWVGKTTALSVFEYAGGSYWKKIYLSKTPCDFPTTTGAWNQGTNANLYLTFGTTGYLSTTVQAGEVWYVMIKNENLWNDQSSCRSTARNCDFAVRLYPPQSN